MIVNHFKWILSLDINFVHAAILKKKLAHPSLSKSELLFNDSCRKRIQKKA